VAGALFILTLLGFEIVVYASIISRIISDIEEQVTNYYSWTIGVTDDPDRRRREHENPRVWYHWDATSETAARYIETYFLDKGMKGDTGGAKGANYVYIFL